MSILEKEIYPTFIYSLLLYTIALSGLIMTLVFIYSDGKGKVLSVLGVAFKTFYPSNKNYMLVLFFQIKP